MDKIKEIVFWAIGIFFLINQFIRYFISGVNITGETTTADVYLKILKNAPRLTIKNIVKAAVDTTRIDKGAFNVIN